MNTTKTPFISNTKRMPILPSLLRFILCALAVLLPFARSEAQTTWNGSTDSNWNNAANWSNGVPTSLTSDPAIFNTSAASVNGNTSITFGAASPLGSLTFDTNAASYVIGAVGGPLVTLTAAGTIQTTTAVANIETINEPLALAGAYAFSSNAAAPDTLNIGGTISLGSSALTLTGTNVGSNSIPGASGVVTIGNNTISGIISGAGGITKTQQGGLWVLTGADTYTGATTVTSGVLEIGNGTSGSINGSSAVTVSNGGILRFDEANGSSVSNSITGGGIVVGAEGAGITNTLSGGIQSSTSFQQLGAGTTVMSGTGNYTGSTNVNNGTLTFNYNANSVSQINNGGSLVVAGGGTLNIDGINGGTTTTTFGTSTVIGFANATNGSLGGNENINFNSGTGGTLNVNLTKLGDQAGSTVNFTLPTLGTVAVAATTITGTNGILETSAGGNVYATVGNDWAALTGGSATTSGNLVAGSSIMGFYTPATSTGFTASTNAQINNTTGTNVAVTASTAITSLQDDYAQPTTIAITSGKTLTTGGILIGTDVGANLTTISGGTLTGTAYSALSIIQDNTSAGLTISSVISGNSLILTKSGAGLLTLSGTNTFTGAIDLNGGITNVSADLNLGAAPTSYVQNNGRNINIIDDATLQLATSFTINSNRGIVLGNGGGIIDTQANTTTFNGVVSAGTGGALTKAGSGSLLLGGANTYSSATNITNGTLSIGNIGNAGMTIGIDNTSTTSITLLTTTGLVNGTTYTLSGSPDRINEDATFTYATGTTTYAITGGQNNFGNSSYFIGVANALGLSTNASTNLTLGSATGATLQYTGVAASTDRLFQLNNTTGGLTDSLDASGSGAINFTNTGAITYGTANTTETLNLTGTNTGANTLTPVVGDNGTGAVSLTKTGVGTWNVNGANTYSGSTSVNAGSLLYTTTGSSNHTSSVSVAAAATLGTATTNASASTLFTNKPALTLNMGASGSQSNLQLSLYSGGNSDTITAGVLTLNGITGSVLVTLNDTTGNNLTAPQYLLMSWTSSTLPVLTSDFTLAGTAASEGMLNVTGDDLYFTTAAVPEPSTWALMLGGLAFLIFWQRGKIVRGSDLA